MPFPPPTPFWTRLIRFETLNGETVFGEPLEEEMDVGLAIKDGVSVYATVWEMKTPWDVGGCKTKRVELVHKLLSPLSADMSGPIRAIGLNYKDHAAEMGLAHPSVPVLFYKPPSSLADPNSPVPIPPVAQDDEMDYEVELAIIIGRDTKNVTEAEAMDHVLGYTVANDLTARKHQSASSQWGYAKGFDKFCPVGPVIVSARALVDPHVVHLQTKVNGQVLQSGSAAKMIFSIQKIVSYLSQGSTLAPGTIIITGTPPGIGDGRDPKIWLKHGDLVECWISHGMGTLVNMIEYE